MWLERAMLSHVSVSQLQAQEGSRTNLENVVGNSQIECAAAQRGNSVSEKITAKRLHELVESQGFACALSGRPLTPDTAELDHITPLSRRGRNTIDNVQVVHQQINRAKGTMTQDEFVAMCQEVTLWNEQQDRARMVS